MNSSTKAAPMTKDETLMLVQLVATNKYINNKATNATNNKLKEQAWQTLTNEFNSSVTSFTRTPSQLRLKWENLKKSARKRCANMRSSLNKTGGGKDFFPPDEVLDTVASLLGSTCNGFSVEFGGDASKVIGGESNTSIDSDQGEGFKILTIHAGDGDGNGIGGGDGDGQEEVLKEIEIIETPPPKQNKFFFTRASGSGSLAKRKHKMEEEKCKARIFRENALAEYLLAKKKKLDIENEEKEVSLVKLKLELEHARLEIENARLENLKLKADLNLV